MKNKKLSWVQVFSSVLWACFGVQDSKTHNRDFQSNEKGKFFVAGVIILFFFVISVFLLAKLVMFILI